MINTYHNAIRDLVALSTKKGQTWQVIRYQVGRDEIHDPTLIAYRVYGNRDDSDVIMVCAGTNTIWQPLPEREILLPTPTQLFALKKLHAVFGGQAVDALR